MDILYIVSMWLDLYTIQVYLFVKWLELNQFMYTVLKNC